MTQYTLLDNFIALLRESVIIQGSLTLIFACLYGYMLVMQIEVSEQFYALFGLIIGFYFGSKSQMSTNEAIRRVSDVTKRV
jgi:hypothetical protein